MKLVGYKAHDLYKTMRKIAALDDEGKRWIVAQFLNGAPVGTLVEVTSIGTANIILPLTVVRNDSIHLD